MVRNERDPQGTSISEQYGRPVTASDVEDLMHQLRVPSGHIYKIMQAVRQALIWTRYTAVRPWAGDLEDGLTRQESERRERRHEQERAQLAARELADAEAGDTTGPRAAAVAPVPSSVNTPEQTAEQVWAQQVLDWQRMDARARGGEVPVTGATPDPGTMSPPASPEPATALSGPQEDIPEDPEADARIEEILAEVFTEVPEPPAATVPASPRQDAPREPAAALSDVASPLPGATVPPASPEAATGLSGLRMSKRCAKCGKLTPLEFFQRDAQAKDGHRARCKVCTSESDEFRRRMRQLRKTLLAAAQDVQEALDVPGDPEVPPEAAEAPEAAPEPVQVLLPPREFTDAELEEIRQRLEEVSARVTVLAPVEQADEVIVLTGQVSFDPTQAEETGNDDYAGQRVCVRCGTLRGVSGFYLRKDGRVRNVCIECERKATRDRRAAKRSSSA